MPTLLRAQAGSAASRGDKSTPTWARARSLRRFGGFACSASGVGVSFSDGCVHETQPNFFARNRLSVPVRDSRNATEWEA